MTLTPEQIHAQQAKLLPALKGRKAHGRRPVDRTRMNKTELAYANHLFARQIDGEIAWFEFEPIKFRLADRCWYTADFIILTEPYLELQFHETKGWMEDDAAVKLRLFPAIYWMFRIFIVRRGADGGWDLEERTL